MKIMPVFVAVTFACIGPIASAEEAVEISPQVKEKTEQQIKIKQSSAVSKKIKEATHTGTPDVGPKNAAVQILAFTTASAMPKKTLTALKHVITQNPDKVRIVFKFTDAGKADAASWAAANQGKFWDMYQAVMSDQGSAERYAEIAKKLELDLTRLEEDMNSSGFKDQVKQNQALMEEIKVSELPTFFVNTQRHTGAQGLPRVVFEHLNLRSRDSRMSE